MDPIRAYFDSLKGKSISVVGIGVSHRPLIALLLSQGLDVTAYDRKSLEDLGEFGREYSQKGLKFTDTIIEYLYTRSLRREIRASER